MVCRWHCPRHSLILNGFVVETRFDGVSFTLQIMGVGTCPFIFSLSKYRSWQNDCPDLLERMRRRSPIAGNLVLNRTVLYGLASLGCCIDFQGQPSWAGCFNGGNPIAHTVQLLGPDWHLALALPRVQVTWQKIETFKVHCH